MKLNPGCNMMDNGFFSPFLDVGKNVHMSTKGKFSVKELNILNLYIHMWNIKHFQIL